MAETGQIYEWTDPKDGAQYRIQAPTDPRVNLGDYIQSAVKAERARKATLAAQAKKFPSAQERGAVTPTGSGTEQYSPIHW